MNEEFCKIYKEALYCRHLHSERLKFHPEIYCISAYDFNFNAMVDTGGFLDIYPDARCGVESFTQKRWLLSDGQIRRI